MKVVVSKLDIASDTEMKFVFAVDDDRDEDEVDGDDEKRLC